MSTGAAQSPTRLKLESPYNGDGVLVLADGRVFHGKAFGAQTTAVGEVVFNTSMSGYQEILSDPSYAGQFVCLTATEIGNVGVNPEDEESEGLGAVALLARAVSPVTSNWRSRQDLGGWLASRGVPGLAEFDTRALTRHLRERGAMMGVVCTEPKPDLEALKKQAAEAEGMEGRNLAAEVSTRAPYTWTEPSWEQVQLRGPAPEADVHVVAYDFGIKRNILRMLADVGAKTTVVPADTPADEVLAMKPDGVFLSNGPGDPAALGPVIDELGKLLEAQEKAGFPVFGICLGHQLLCLALGGKTYKLKFGHHGGNHPVRASEDGRVAITAQNHGFAVDAESLAAHGARSSEINLFDQTVAALNLASREVKGVQYHPEASPGPHDAADHFADFVTAIREHKASKASA